MPELPEVETLTRQLQPVLKGKTVQSVAVLRAKSFHGNPSELEGLHVRDVKRIAKIIVITFAQQFPQVLVHLKMTGQLIYDESRRQSRASQKAGIKPTQGWSSPSAGRRIAGGHPTRDWVATLPNKHTRVVITFTDKSTLFFNDMRVFGWLKVVCSKESFNKELKGFSGVDPLSSQFTVTVFKEKIGDMKRPIKIALMDQVKVAGVGNIYANDALWNAGIHPKKLANNLTDTEWKKLCQSIGKVITMAISFGGSSERDYRHMDGGQGTYQNHFLVYKQHGTACKRCGTIIEKISLGGRGTYYCPHCQK